MSLRALAAEAEALIEALTDEQRHAALDGLRMMVVTSRYIQLLPGRLTKVIGLGFIELAVKHYAGTNPESLLAQVTAGSPKLGRFIEQLERGEIADGQGSARLELRPCEEEIREQGGGAGAGPAPAGPGEGGGRLAALRAARR